MKHVIFIFEHCALFEVVLLANFLRSQGEQVVIAGEKEIVQVHEGFTIQTDLLIEAVDMTEIKSFTITGGNPAHVINKNQLKNKVSEVYRNSDQTIGAICGGVHIVSQLLDIEFSQLNTADVEQYENIVVSPPNKYVDFAITMLKVMGLYKDEADYKETVRFFKEFNT